MADALALGHVVGHGVRMHASAASDRLHLSSSAFVADAGLIR
jgi:hypothetical protein